MIATLYRFVGGPLDGKEAPLDYILIPGERIRIPTDQGEAVYEVVNQDTLRFRGMVQKGGTHGRIVFVLLASMRRIMADWTGAGVLRVPDLSGYQAIITDSITPLLQQHYAAGMATIPGAKVPASGMVEPVRTLAAVAVVLILATLRRRMVAAAEAYREKVRQGADPKEALPELIKSVRVFALDRRHWDLVAADETYRMEVAGRHQAAVASGRPLRKAWRVFAHDEKLCKICNALDGQVRQLHELFNYHVDNLIGAILHPLAHPNCRCRLEYI